MRRPSIPAVKRPSLPAVNIKVPSRSSISKKAEQCKQKATDKKSKFQANKKDKKDEFERLQEYLSMCQSVKEECGVDKPAVVFFINEGVIQQGVLSKVSNAGAGKKLGLGKGYTIKVEWKVQEVNFSKTFTSPRHVHLCKEEASVELDQIVQKLKEKQERKAAKQAAADADDADDDDTESTADSVSDASSSSSDLSTVDEEDQEKEFGRYITDVDEEKLPPKRRNTIVQVFDMESGKMKEVSEKDLVSGDEKGEAKDALDEWW